MADEQVEPLVAEGLEYKPSALSKINWVGILTILLSNATLLLENNQGAIPAEYVAIAGSIIGTLTVILRTFTVNQPLTIRGKPMSD